MAPRLQLFPKLVGNAFTIAVVGFAIAISLGKIFALRHGYRVDSNQVWGSQNVSGAARSAGAIGTGDRGPGGTRETAKRRARPTRGAKVGR